MTQIQHWAKMAQTDHVTLRLWPLILEVIWRIWLMRVVVLHPYTKSEVLGPDVRKIWHKMCVSINGPGDLDLWPWNWYVSRIKGGEPLGSPVIRYVRDGQMDKTNTYWPLSYGWGHSNRDLKDQHANCAVCTETRVRSIVRNIQSLQCKCTRNSVAYHNTMQADTSHYLQKTSKLHCGP